MSIAPINPIPVNSDMGLAQLFGLPNTTQSAAPSNLSFGQILMQGIETTNARVAEADRLVKAFAVDDSVPVHQVTLALEQAKLSLEMMIQVRNHVVDAFQQIMNMQL